MSKSVMVAVAVLVLNITPAAAAMDCSTMLQSHMSEIVKMNKTTSEKRAALTRMVLSGYDSCMAGDMISAERYFKMIMDNAN